MSDKLVEVLQSDLTILRDLYKIDWPRNHVGFYTLNNYINWLAKDPNIENLKICSLNNDWSDGTFLIVDNNQLFFNSLNKTNDRLTTALSLLDWSSPLMSSTFLDRHRPALLNVIKSKQLEVKMDLPSYHFYMSKSEASKLDISPPDGITLRSLSENNVERINELWPHRQTNSELLVKRLLNWNANIGAFTQDGKLVAWCLRLQAGPLGLLQVEETAKRQGLGGLVVKAMAKKLADLGEDTFACAIESNNPSKKMFEKNGFKHMEKVSWLIAQSSVPSTGSNSH